MNSTGNRSRRIAFRAAAAFALLLGAPRPAHSAARIARGMNASMLSAFPFSTADDGDEKDEREQELYEGGTDAIDESHWQQAVEKFDQVIQMHGKRADAALYWKAWAQNKLGKRQDALATLGELKRTAPQSRWMNDGKALEIEIRQASNQSISPEAQSDCELKLLAINGLQQMDPERAVPML
ncbi:MAG TPA: tetratricopeptide repeat protein, partial [Candidatus Acidoferrales bacterium]|nr:tetratricopeptide repeat protein [Candidatus Acidoferrales bacterium]